MTKSELLNLRWLWIKVRRRVESNMHARRVRAAASAHVPPSMEPVAPALPWAPNAAPPGNAAMPPMTAQVVDAARQSLAADAYAHRVAVLSPSPCEINLAGFITASGLRGTEEIPAATVAAYRRIDWHRDFRSGHRWDPREFYLDVRVAPVAGADIKVPRELSRFQHVGALASLPAECGAPEFLLQLLDWIDANPVRRGVNWACTMDVALRVVNWIWGLRLFEHDLVRFTPALRIVAQSIHEHGRHIEDNLEYYEECTGNHYLADIAGLVYIGAAFPQFPESDRWLLFGMQELVSETKREVYADGAAHEASTHYHRLVAELFASCAAVVERVPMARRRQLLKVERRAHRVRPRLRPPAASGLNLESHGAILPPAFYASLARMVDFTVALTKPNGLMPQVGDNDSARVHKLPGIAADVRDHGHLAAVLGELLDRPDLRAAGSAAAAEGSLIAGDLRGVARGSAAAPGAAGTPRLFADAGMVVGRVPDAWLLFTCGQNGQGGRGGHGHNDKNSFELNVRGVDFIVDGGCPFYSSAPDVRNRYRSTAAHSTISVEGLEQDRWSPGVAGLFRLPQRSRPEISLRDDGSIVGRHSGFGAVHERRLRLENRRVLIEDQLECSATRWIHFNLDPAVSVEGLVTTDDRVTCELVHPAGIRLRLSLDGVAEAECILGAFGVGFGCPQPNSAVRARLTRATVHSEISWT